LKPVAPATEIYGHRAASPQQYMICGGYASLFFRLDFIGGLAYSSIATDCKGVNVALKGSVADQYVVAVIVPGIPGDGGLQAVRFPRPLCRGGGSARFGRGKLDGSRSPVAMATW
jgi:hypothetical protein